MQLKALVDKALANEKLNEEDCLFLIRYKDQKELFAAAAKITREKGGNDFALCSIVNLRSGACSEDCKWCAQSGHYNARVTVYPLLDKKKVAAIALKNEKAGAARFSFVTSGKGLDQETLEQLLSQAESLKKVSKLKLCASLGLINSSQLKQLKERGISRYHCNIETAPSFFNELCSTHSLEDKLVTIKLAKDAGLAVCSGGIIGMGETVLQRIEFCLLLRELEVDSIPLNILTPIPGTPLANVPQITDNEVLEMAALLRFTNPLAKIRFAGGRKQISHLQETAMKIGVNGAIVGDLLTTQGLSLEEDVQQLLTWHKTIISKK